MIEDGVPDLICAECGLRYIVVYNYDGLGGAADYCPRCGETIELPDPSPLSPDPSL